MEEHNDNQEQLTLHEAIKDPSLATWLVVCKEDANGNLIPVPWEEQK